MNHVVTLVLSLVMAGISPSWGYADEVDTILAQRYANFASVKKIKFDTQVEVERPATAQAPAKTVRLHYKRTMTVRDRTNSDPMKRFDAEFEVLEPIPMRFKFEDGHFRYLTNAGDWVQRDPSGGLKDLLAHLDEGQAVDPVTERQHFEVRRLKSRDNFWGTKKGLEFIPKGHTPLYSRREEVVDVATGQAIEIHQFDDRGQRTMHHRITKMANRSGVLVPQEMESESEGPSGSVVQRTRNVSIEVETE